MKKKFVITVLIGSALMMTACGDNNLKKQEASKFYKDTIGSEEYQEDGIVDVEIDDDFRPRINDPEIDPKTGEAKSKKDKFSNVIVDCGEKSFVIEVPLDWEYEIMTEGKDFYSNKIEGGIIFYPKSKEEGFVEVCVGKIGICGTGMEKNTIGKGKKEKTFWKEEGSRTWEFCFWEKGNMFAMFNGDDKFYEENSDKILDCIDSVDEI